ncbi:MAG: FMN-binding protein [Gammaproteobacteria bacterium]|nr:FMN-binding protein [Gammaproteobacteria bacterium]
MTVTEQTAAAPAPPSSIAMVRTLGGIAMLSGFLVVLVYQLTLPAILENQRRAIERAVFLVVPGAVSRVDFQLAADGLNRVTEDTEDSPDAIAVYAGFDADGALKGVALEAAAPGYQDVIKLLYGYDPACECITGIYVLKMTETPGLGDKIATDQTFLANFKALDARLSAAGDSLQNAIVTVKHGTKKAPWQIDAISGATVSCKAVGRALNESAHRILPRLQPAVNQLKVEE